MGKKEKKEKKEKPLEKMTSKELKEVALETNTISGVHGMNKNELISAIRELRGIHEEEGVKSMDVRELKKKVAALREQKTAAKSAGDKFREMVLRRKMNRLKKKTRKAA
ncbi:MAG: transcription termination factor Rho [Pseudomonadota bacterium]